MTETTLQIVNSFTALTVTPEDKESLVEYHPKTLLKADELEIYDGMCNVFNQFYAIYGVPLKSVYRVNR